MDGDGGVVELLLGKHWPPSPPPHLSQMAAKEVM